VKDSFSETYEKIVLEGDGMIGSLTEMEKRDRSVVKPWEGNRENLGSNPAHGRLLMSASSLH